MSSQEEAKKKVIDYESTIRNVPIPFERTRKIYHKISDWFVIVSAGTLLWSIGNFDKFIVKTADGTSYMFHKHWYMVFLCLFFLSTAIFAYLHASVYLRDYFDMRLREISGIQNRMADKKFLSKAEETYYNNIYNEYKAEHNKEVLKKEPDDKRKDADWIGTIRDKSINQAVTDFGGKSLHMRNVWVNRWSGVGVICYLLGLALSAGYVIAFLWYYPDP